MKLHRLLVTNFAAVREVDISFGPGLNVLYGPNDLGKSTLAEAIRMALLLPHASTASEEFVGWTGGRDPVVDLTFETEPQRIWRVRKEFGKGGSSLLQESRNGQDFDDVERSRKVDGRLREILRWGIPEPGGSGGGKGLPSSFLATALLSTQADVTAMLRDSLEGDSTASGKERIAAALQAVAQDPLFVALLRNVQGRRDEAYTDKGAKKSGKGSVFKVTAERVRETREEKEKLQKVVGDSEGAEKQLQALHELRLQRQEALTVARVRVIELESMAKQVADRVAAAEQVRLAQEEVQRIRKLGTDVEEAEKESRKLLAAEEQAGQALKIAQKGKYDADAVLKAAQETAGATGSDSTASELVRPQIELRIAAAEKAMVGVQQRVDATLGAKKLVEAATDAERDHREQQAKALRARELLAQASANKQTTNDELSRCDLLEKALDLRTAEKAMADARIAVDRHSALQVRFESNLAERTVLAARRATFIVPSSSALAPMRKLATDLAGARGALDVGLVVTVTPKRPLDIAIRKDTKTSDSVSTDGSFEIEAATEVEIDLAGLALVHVRGGRREAQEKVRVLEGRWNLEVAPILTAANAADLASLESKVVEAQELDNGIKTKDTEIESLRNQISPLTSAAEVFQHASERLANCRSALGSEPMAVLSPEIDALGADPVSGLRKKREQLSKVAEAARTFSNDAATASTLAEERASNLQALLSTSIEKRDLALSDFPEGVDKTLALVQSNLVAAIAEEQNGKAELASLDQTIALRKARIEEAVAGARTSCEQAQIELEAAERGRTEAMTRHASQLGRLTELKKLRDAEDLVAAETKLRDATTHHAALPQPERLVTEEEVDAAKNTEAGLTSALEGVVRDIQRAQGALEQVGGAVARERLRDAIEAFEQAQQHDRETEADYEAWKLLLDQMKEADAAQASNLGLVIGPAIASRFQALTDRRYENVRFTAGLGTEGVVVAGAVRSSERMSVGTREQLSTLYRLSLAEYLQTVVVLDDQLVQSDESRMDWFRALLKEKSRNFQIVVFTCRPRDYVEKTSMVPKGKSLHADTDEGFTRTIDLGRAFGSRK